MLAAWKLQGVALRLSRCHDFIAILSLLACLQSLEHSKALPEMQRSVPKTPTQPPLSALCVSGSIVRPSGLELHGF